MPRPLSQQAIQDFRAQLCDAAERLFAEHGYEGVTLRALAAAQGCSPMTPYRYFENKEAIFAAVRTSAFVRFGERIMGAGASLPDPVERIRAFGHEYFAFAREEPHAYRIMFELAKPAGLDAEMLADPSKRQELLTGWSPLVETMAEGVAAGRFVGDPLTLAHLAWITLHGLVSLDLSEKLILGRSLDELVEPAIESLIHGISARSEPTSHTAPSDPNATRPASARTHP